jgi:hypothetical protein
MTENYQAFHNLFHTSCSMRAELDRLLFMAEAYPHFQEILVKHFNAAVDSEMVLALSAAKKYELARAFPPRHIVEQLYVASVQMLDKLDSIERDRLAAVGFASTPSATTEQRQVARLVEDFNVNVGEVTGPAREAIEAIRGFLPAPGQGTKNDDPQTAVATVPSELDCAAI